MDSLHRLMELAGQRYLAEDLPPAHDEMSQQAAQSVFARAGEFVTQVTTQADLRGAWITLQRRFHEAGRTPDAARLALVNRAYQVLKKSAPATAPEQPDEDAQEYVLWGWDGRFLVPGYQVSAKPAQFPEVARTALQKLRRGFKVPRGIVLQTGREMLLVYLDGHDLNPPPDYPCYRDPRGDQTILNWLSSQSH